MRHAAFFRNLNLGRPNCPGRVQFEQAFLDAGAHDAASFLSNGTLVFTMGSRASPERLLQKAAAVLRRECGLVEPGFVRPLPYLATLVADDPFAAIDRAAVLDCCVTLLAPGGALPGLPLLTPRGDVEVFAFSAGGGEAFSIRRRVGRDAGSPNALLEKRLAVPATSRVWNTVVRLVHKHGV